MIIIIIRIIIFNNICSFSISLLVWPSAVCVKVNPQGKKEWIQPAIQRKKQVFGQYLVKYMLTV